VAADTWAAVHTAVRQVLDDRDIDSSGLVWTDANLYDFDTEVQRDLFLRLCESGRQSAKKTITPVLEIGETTFSFDEPVGDTLPEDFIVPEKLWEKTFGADDTAYVEMSNRAERLPDEPAAETLRYWVWTDDGTDLSPKIQTLGATTKRTVRIQYYKQPPPVSAVATRLYIPGSYNVLIPGVAAKCSVARKRWDVAMAFKSEYEFQIGLLEKVLVKPEQRRNRRRFPYRYAGFYKP
jgi:hypothetical protein